MRQARAFVNGRSPATGSPPESTYRPRLAIVVALVLGPLLVPARAQTIRFARGPALQLRFDDRPGLRPFVLADINGDERADLIAAATSPQERVALAVALNDGDGSFSAFQFFEEPEGTLTLPAALTVADFGSPAGTQLDGIPDVAIACANRLLFAMGDGLGHFAFSDLRLEVGTGNLVDIVNGELDGHNGADLAVVDEEGSLITLCRSASTGFEQCLGGTTTSTAGANPGPIARGDVNGDGVVDLVVLNRGAADRRGSIAIFLGHGDGSFALMSPLFDVGKPNATDIAVGRLDEDAIDDIVVTFLEPFGGDSVQVFIGRPTGRLRPGPVLTGLSFLPSAVTIADFDGDGTNDLAAPQLQDDLATAIMRGNGNGGFNLIGSSIGLVTGSGLAVDVADLDGDQLPDLVVLRNDRQQLRVAINVSDEILPPTVTRAATASPTATRTLIFTPTATASVTRTPTHAPTGGATATVPPPPTAVPTRNHPFVDDDGCAITPRANSRAGMLLAVVALVLGRRWGR